MAQELLVRVAGWRFHPQGRYLTSPSNLHVPLTAAEADLLFTFCQHPQRPVTREQLAAWTRSKHAVTPSRAIDIQAGRLRRKMASDGVPSDAIQTVRSDGYPLHYQVGIAEP